MSQERRLQPTLLRLFLAAALASAPAAAGEDQVLQWRRWEKVLTSARDYTANDGNPYRDLALEVTFTREAPLLQVSGAGFWDGGRTFKIRTALPPGTWRWTTSCVGATGGQSCGSPDGSGRDPGLWQSGSLRVLPSAAGPEIYRRGFLQVADPAGTDGARHLAYGDGTPFFWLGDTAWQAPVAATEAQWASYLENRRQKGFSAVLMAPATQYQGAITSFEPVGGCSSPAVPNACSRWIPAHWQNLDSLVEQANRAGIVAVLAGLINPVGRGGGRTPRLYPAVDDAAIFARNLAARLAGNFVVFSPGFDDRIGLPVSGGPATVRDSMEAVGRMLQRTASRHLVANHLAGASSLADYDVFQAQSWLSFQLFQSGHALNLSACRNGETRQQCAARRARELPLGLRRLLPAKPAANGEGGYEYPLDAAAAPPDNRYGVRQTAYSSVLSGAFGFTLGVKGIYDWSDPLAVLDSPSSFDLTYLAGRFRHHPWQELVPWPERVLDGGDEPQQRRRVLAGTPDDGLALAYLPNADAIHVATGPFPGLDCGPAWSKLWVDPRTGRSFPADPCTASADRIALARPPCRDPDPDVTGACDWALELRNTLAALSANSGAGDRNAMQVWADVEPGGGTAGIRARLFGPDGKLLRDGIVVSPAGSSLQKLPTVARDARGAFFVVWQAERAGGDLPAILGRRFGPDGRPLGRAFRVGAPGAEPTATADARGRIVVVWTGPEGIVGQRFDASGGPLGRKIRVGAPARRGRSGPQVMADAAGNFVVAWRSAGQDGDGRGVYARLFDRRGRPRGPRILVSGAAGEPFLVALRVAPEGEFSVRWTVLPRAGEPKLTVEQWFGRDGRRLGERPVSASIEN